MSLVIKGGPANSGTKQGKQEPRAAWLCSQGHPNRGWCIRCLHAGCNEARPK